MCGIRISKSKRIASGIVGIMMLVIVLFSTFYIATHSDHICNGTNCPICACIQQCEKNLHHLANGLSGQDIAALPVTILIFSIFSIPYILVQGTPVSRKIRLND